MSFYNEDTIIIQKQMNTLLQSIIIFILTFLISCGTTKNSLIDSNHNKTFEQAWSKLQQGKSTEKNKQLLILSLDKILKSAQIQKDTLTNQTSLNSKEKLCDLNTLLIDKLNKAVPYTSTRYTGKLDSLEMVTSPLKTYLKTTYFEQGKENLEAALQEKDKVKSQKAFVALEKAEKYGMTESTMTTLKSKVMIMVI